MTDAVDQAIDDWMAELEGEEAACQVAAERLAEPDPSDERGARVYKESARLWLARGHGRVALALLDRAMPAQASAQGGPRTPNTLPIEAMQLGLPGFGGLPALTPEETAALRACGTPDEALIVIAGAKARLQAHGEEARRLLRRWVARERGGDPS